MFEPEYFEWDEAKAASNLNKHYLAFNEATRIFDDPDRMQWDVSRDADGERRFKIVGRFRARLFAVVFTMRGSVCRLISARRANSQEERMYGHRQI